MCDFLFLCPNRAVVCVCDFLLLWIRWPCVRLPFLCPDRGSRVCATSFSYGQIGWSCDFLSYGQIWRSCVCVTPFSYGQIGR